jgi:hypothetical protein
MIRSLGGRPPASLSDGPGLATLWTYLVGFFLNTVCLTVTLACGVVRLHVHVHSRCAGGAQEVRRRCAGGVAGF